jgi:hypothetical protein
MICFALIVSGIALALFILMVASIQLSERRCSLGQPSGGFADAFTRKVLAVHAAPASKPRRVHAKSGR